MEELGKQAKELMELLEDSEKGDGSEKTRIKLLAAMAMASMLGKSEGKSDDKENSSGKIEEALSEMLQKKKCPSAEANAIHVSNTMRIYKLIDKIEANVIIGDMELQDSVHIRFPEVESFSLGDRVIVDLPMTNFKFLQRNCMFWHRKLSNIRGKPGFVTGVSNKYHGVVEVYIPSVLTCTQIWAGTLSRTEEEIVVPSRWKVNDYVMTRKNKELVRKFQKHLPDIPEKNIGKRGRVIAVASVAVYVTFNEKSSYAVNPALLRISDDTTPIKVTEKTGHPKKILIGDKVKVIRNLRKLIKNQKGYGGWNWKMCSLAGKIVNVTKIRKDGSLLVALPNSRGWRINFESVCKIDENIYEVANDLPYLPGDKVRLKLTEDIKMQLVGKKIRELCIDFLKLTGEVVGIDRDFDVVVRFTQDKTHTFNPSILRKATKREEKNYDDIECLRRCLAKGSIVRLDVGPMRYAEGILRKIKVNKSTMDAIMQPARILGYTGAEHAVIEYNDGRKIRINGKYLAPAEKYDLGKPRSVEVEDVLKLLTSIKSCVATIHLEREEEYDENSVDLFSVISGSPPTVRFRISSLSATPDLLMKRMSQIMDIKLTETDSNECLVEIQPGKEVAVIFLYFDDDSRDEKVKCLDELTGDEDEEKKVEDSQESSEETTPGNKAAPFVDPQAGNLGNAAAAPPPQPQPIGGFSYLTLQTANGPLSIPCVWSNNRVEAAAQQQVQPDRNGRDRGTINIINKGNIENFNLEYN